MYIDASAIVAILNEEPDAGELQRKLLASQTPRYICGVTFFEAVVSIARSRTPAHKSVDRSLIDAVHDAVAALLESLQVRDVSITHSIAQGAIDAAAIYGKTVGHRAGLNMGDCFSYATAKAYRVPILYKGNDFAETDMG